MGQGHCKYMHELDVGELTAVCDIVPEVAKEVEKMMADPAFQAEMKKMTESPERMRDLMTASTLLLGAICVGRTNSSPPRDESLGCS